MTALCRSAEHPGEPCRFTGICHQARQELQSRLNLRGKDCWAYSLLVVEAAYDPAPQDVEREAIRGDGA